MPFHVVWLESETTIQLIHPQGSSQFVSSVHIAALSGIVFFFRALSAEEEIVRSPEETWGFSEVGACPLAQHRRLPRPILASMDGSGSGCLGRGGLARGIQETEGDMIHRRPSPLTMLLVYMPASLQSPPSHWPSPCYDDFISSGLQALYRCPLRGPPISPARRGNGSCNCVRS